MNSQPLLSHLAIVLVRPKIPENIGAAARIAWNMGITRLIIIRDDLPEREAMAKMATHKAAHLIDNLEIYPNLAEALVDFSIVVGTTARRGRQRSVEKTPRELVDTLLPLLATNQVAILFGPEDTGLSNDDLKYCQMSSAIPTADFSSLNLAQAVAIHCYEIYHGVVHAQKNMAPAPQLATSHELESMYAYLEESLYSIDFLNEVSHIYWMTNIRRFFSRITLTSKDANIVRTVCKKLLLHQKNLKTKDLGDP
ncbi:MAG: RNA methyltransferase [Pseudomonadota bacterium]